MTKRFITPHEASEYLSLNLKTVYSLAARGLLPVIRFGRQLRIDLTKLNDYIEETCPAVGSTHASPHVRPGRPGIHTEGKACEKGQT